MPGLMKLTANQADMLLFQTCAERGVQNSHSITNAMRIPKKNAEAY